MNTQLTMVYWKSDTFWLGKLLEHDAYLLMAMDDVPEDYQTKTIRCEIHT